MKRTLVLLLVLAVAAAAFAGGGKEAAAPAAAAERLPSFVRNNLTEPQGLDPVSIQGVPEHNIYMALFEGLVSYHPETLKAVPGVAESWTLSNDGTTVTFKLRRGAVWSDGTPITAQQFVDSWLRFLNPDTAAEYAYMVNMVIEGAEAYNSGEGGPEAVQIRAVDDHTFQVDLVGPAPYAVDMMAHYAFAVHPLHVIQKHGQDWTRPGNLVSNGPFVLKEWIPNDKIVVVKNDKYWDAANVRLGQITFLPIEDENTAVNLYLEGSVDWIEQVPDARLDEMKLHPTYNHAPAFITYYYLVNTTRKPFDDVRVRKALALAIDRKEIVEKVTRGGQFPAYGMTPPLAGIYPAVAAFKEDAETARRLLSEAGFPSGRGFPQFTILYNTHEGHKRIAEYVQQKWSEVLGLRVQIENQEWKTYLDNRFSQNFDVARAGWQGDYVDPNTFLDMFICNSEMNDGKWCNPAYDELIYKAARMPDGKERYDTLRQAEEILVGQDMGVIPFYFYTRTNWIDLNKWGGWYENILDVHPYKNIYRK